MTQMKGAPRCSRCHRVLTDPVSISLGIGPECRNGSSHNGGRKASNGHRFGVSEQLEDGHLPPLERNYEVMPGNELEKLDMATRMLAEAKTLDQVKNIMDIAEAARVYARAAKLGLEAANHASEIKLRAERKAGDLLRQLERSKGGQPTHSSMERVEKSEYREVLEEQAIPTTTAHRWQQIASVPETKFEEHIAATRDAGKELTESGLLKSFNYKRDTKAASAQDIYTPQGMDACQTPAYALDPLLPYLTGFKTIWEPACGEGLLVDALQDCTPDRFTVIGSDILDGRNFFDFEPDGWDCLVTNPPYSIKFQWIARCYTLGKPFALLMPVETLGAKTAQDLFERYGVEILLLDKRVNFKMPVKGWEASGSQFPVFWLCWKLLPQQVMFGKITNGKKGLHDYD